MCRHVAYVGRTRTLREVLCDPPHGLLRQSWAPRRQAHGTVNADGFGVGWYADGDPVPARYRSARPVWSDESFVDLARVVSTTALLAAVRDASPGMPYAEAAVAPFRHGGHLFSHNGRLAGWPAVVDDLAADLRPSELVGGAALTDSAVLWALVRRRLDDGMPAAQAVAEVVQRALDSADAAGAVGTRLNLLVSDGRSIIATACGDTLCWRLGDGGVVVASEPYDDEPGWNDVPDGSLLLATAEGVDVTCLRLS